jgi:hypothetical protein
LHNLLNIAFSDRKEHLNIPPLATYINMYLLAYHRNPPNR